MVIKNARIFNGITFIDYMNVVIKDNKIIDITNNDVNDDNVIDAKMTYLVPGLIDIHTHGIMGYDLNEINSMQFNKAIDSYNKSGTTSLLPTTVSQQVKKTIKLIEHIKQSENKSVIGVHLEAPYINPKKLGAQNKSFIESPSVKRFNDIYKDYLKYIKRVTIAPELDINFSLVKYLVKNNIVCSFGHTLCDSKTGEEAFDLGCKLATHFFNAMPNIHHREVSITGKALIRDDVTVEIISDLIHVCEDIIKLIIKTKPIDKVIIISDSMSATGLGDGEFILSSKLVTVKNKIARIKEGNLAGSLITMLDGVKNYIKIGVKFEDAFRFATYNPALLLNLEDKIGMIKIGNDADLLILDNELNINNVICKGKTIL